MATKKDKALAEKEELQALLSDRHWRLNNLYYIKNFRGEKQLFKFNLAQADIYKNIWYFNVILKARQLGFTTFIMIYFLDACLFNDNHSAGIIAHTRDDAEDLFRSKIKFAYDNLPQWLREAIPAKQDSARRLEFSNGSSITVGTSLRSGTFQKLLVSELGKIAARHPEKALEIKTGALNTVHLGQQIFVESTAEGKAGEFYDVCERARKLKEASKQLTRMDPRFHFYGWNWDVDYKLTAEEAGHTVVNQKMADYFASLPFDMTPEQKAWYVKKSEQQGDLMKREFPSTPSESFEQSMEGAYYTQQMTLIRKNGQITHVPYELSKPVFTFWDLGLNDDMTIWFFQKVGNRYNMIDYHESNGEGWDFYTKLLVAKGYVYAEHVWPHDGNKRIQGKEVRTSKQIAMELGIRPIRIVLRTDSVGNDISNYCKPILPRVWFDEVKCAVGINHLDNYRKEWDDKGGVWKDRPRHDQSSHCADGFRTFAVGFQDRQDELQGFDPRVTEIDMDHDYF